MKGTDQIFSLRQVKAGLTAQGSIDHRKQGRRNSNPIDPAHIRGCGKARYITDHTTTERDHCAFAIEAVIKEPMPERADHFKVFVSLTCRMNQTARIEVSFAQ